VFAYEYHPGGWIDPEEESEGIDWWNRDKSHYEYGSTLRVLDTWIASQP